MLLTFRLIGINNQNAMLEDIESRSWWQQASGEAIAGPLTGMRLTPLVHDEVTLRAVGARASGDQGAGPGRSRVRHRQGLGRSDGQGADRRPGAAQRSAAPPRPTSSASSSSGKAKAYPKHQARAEQPARPKKPAMTYAVMDRVGGVPVAVLVGGDGISVRVFDRRVDGKEIELMTKFGSSPARFVDTTTGSEWDISGTAVSGPMAGDAARAHPVDDRVLVRLAAAPPGHAGPQGVAAAAGP